MFKLTLEEKRRKRWKKLVEKYNKQYTPEEINRFRQLRNDWFKRKKRTF